MAEPEEMPVDSAGNRADIIMDPNSTVSRMNLGRVYEMYINSASRDSHKLVCNILGIEPFISEAKALKLLEKVDVTVFNNAWNTLLGYYKIVSPKMYAKFDAGEMQESPHAFMAFIICHGIYLFLPTDNEPESPHIIRQLENGVYKPTYGPVTYIGNSGKSVTTKGNVRIGSIYFILLEKIGDDWSSVASAKLSHFGVPSQLTKADKYSKPARNQAVRGAGEAEVRIFSSYVSERFTAEMMDRNNNPQTHKLVVKNLVSAPSVGNISNLVDRSKNPFGGSKPLQLVSHIAAVGGWKFSYSPYIPNWNMKK